MTPGGAELSWIKPDGKTQASVPAAVKSDHAAALKELKAMVKEIDKLLPSQRIRIEQLYLQERSWPLTEFRQRYLDHPLIGAARSALDLELLRTHPEFAARHLARRPACRLQRPRAGRAFAPDARLALASDRLERGTDHRLAQPGWSRKRLFSPSSRPIARCTSSPMRSGGPRPIPTASPRTF